MNSRTALFPRQQATDRGSILIIVLVVSVVLSVVVVSLATYAATTLRYGQVVEESADRLTASDGGMDHVLEDLERRSSGCDSGLGGGAGGYQYAFAAVNGLNPVINCRIIGGNASLIDSYAVVMTGANGQTGPMLHITNGGGSPQAIKIFEGRVYMAAKPSATTTDFNANLTIKDGDLWYSDGSCPQNGTVTDLKNDPIVGPSLSRLSFVPTGRSTKCFIEPWADIFGTKRPDPPTSGQLDNPALFPVRTGPTVDIHGCSVWLPGRYNQKPLFANGSYNFFRSGNYFFNNVGTINVEAAYVLAGYPGVSGPSVVGTGPGDTANTNPCRFEWSNGDTSGATFYMGGSSAIEVKQNGSLEISGKRQGDHFVGLQALDAVPYASSLSGDSRILLAVQGSNKELSVQGTVWAPNSGVGFDTLANDAVGALTAGAVVSELRAGAAANANGLLITVDAQPGEAQLLITSTATNGGTTVTRTIADYRPTDGAIAVVSRRVAEITPE